MTSSVTLKPSSVGTSGLEKQYEDLLSGSLNEYKIDYDSYIPGSSGDNIYIFDN